MRVGVVVVAAGLTLGACGREPPMLSVDKAYIRLAAAPGRPAVAYFTIHGGAADATLIDAGTDVAVRSELHESMTMQGMGGGMASMKPLGDVAVRAGTEVVFAPGGKHLMLFDINPGVKPGRKVTLTFTFADNRRVLATARTIAAGAPAPTE